MKSTAKAKRTGVQKNNYDVHLHSLHFFPPFSSFIFFGKDAVQSCFIKGIETLFPTGSIREKWKSLEKGECSNLWLPKASHPASCPFDLPTYAILPLLISLVVAELVYCTCTIGFFL